MKRRVIFSDVRDGLARFASAGARFDQRSVSIFLVWCAATIVSLAPGCSSNSKPVADPPAVVQQAPQGPEVLSGAPPGNAASPPGGASNNPAAGASSPAATAPAGASTTKPAEAKEPVKGNYFVDFSADGRYAVSGGKNATIRLYDIEKGVLIRTFVGQKEGVSSISIRPDATMVASGSVGGHLMVWDARSVDGLDETERESLGADERIPILAHDGAVKSLAFRPDGRELASGGEDGMIRYWRLPFSYPEPIWTASSSIVLIEAVAQGNRLVAGKSDGSVELWELATSQSLPLIPEGTRAITALAVSSDGKFAAAGDEAGKVKLVDLETRKLMMDAAAHEGEVTGIRFHPKKPQLLTTGADGTTRTFDVQSSSSSSSQSVVYTFQSKGRLLAVSPSGQFAAVSGTNVVEVADIKNRSLLHSLPVDAKEITSLTWSGDDRIIVAGDATGAVHSWNIPGGQKLFESRIHDGAVRALAGTTQELNVASGGADGKIRIWNQPGLPEALYESGKKDGSVIVADPRGQSVAIGAADGSVRIVDVNKKELTATYAAVGKAVAAMAWSPDGEWLACGGKDGIVRVWKVLDGDQSLVTVEAGAPVSQMAFHANGPALIVGLQNGNFRKWNLPFQKSQALSGHTDTITAVVGNRAGTQVITGGNDRLCRLYNVDRGDQVRVFEGAQDGISSVAQIADGSWIAAADRAGQISMWKTDSGELIGSVRTHDSPMTKLACNSINRQLVSASADGLIRIWQAPFSATVQLEDPAQNSVILAISPNGQQIAMGLADSTIAVRDTRTGEQVQTLRGHTGAITALGFSADGLQVISASEDETVGLWQIENGERLVQWEGHSTPPRAVAILPGGGELRACTADGRLVAYARSSRQEKVLQSPKKGTATIAFSPTGKRLALANSDGSVQLVDSESGSLLEKTPASDRVTAISWCADDESWVSLDSARAVKYWKRATLESDRGWTNAPRGIGAIRVSADGSRLLAAGTGGQPTIWSAEGNLLETFDWDTKVNVQSLTLSADGSAVVAVGNDGKFSAFHSSLVAAFKGHDGTADLVAFGGEQVVISAGGDSKISAWDTTNGERIRQFENGPAHALDLVVSPVTGKLIVLGDDQKLYAWNVGDGSPIELPASIGESTFRRLSLNPDGQQMAALDDKSRFRILKLSNLSDVGELPSPVADSPAIELLRGGTVICASESLAFISRGDAAESGTKAHEGAVTGLAAISNRDEFITSGEDGKVKVWSLSGDLARTWVDAGSPIRMFAMKPDAREMVTLGQDNKLKVWNETGESVSSIAVSARLKSVQFNSQSPSTVVTVAENQIRLYQVAKGKALVTISTLDKISAAAIDGENGFVYVNDTDGGVSRFATEPVKTIESEQREIHSLAFSKNGNAIASGGEDFSIGVWKLPNPKLIARLKGHTKPVTGLAFGRDEGQLVSFSTDKTVRSWNVTGSKSNHTMTTTGIPQSLSVSADGKSVAVTTKEKVASVFDLQSGKATQSISAENASVVGVQYLAKGLMTLDSERRLSQSDTSVVRQFPQQPGPITGLDILADGSYFVTTGPNAGMKLVDFSGKVVGDFDTAQGPPKFVSISADFQYVAGVSPDGASSKTLMIWNIADRKQIEPIESPAAIQFVKFEPEPGSLITVCEDKMIRRYRIPDGKLMESITMIENARCEPTFHSSGEILSLDRDDRVRLYQPCLNRMDAAHEGAVTALTYSSNGNLLFSGGQDGRIVIWDSDSAKPGIEFRSGAVTVNDLRVLPNKESLIASYSDNAVRLWPLKRKASEPDAEFMHKANVRCAGISSDSKLMVSGGADQIVHLWTIATGGERELVQFRGHEGAVSKVVITPDNKSVISFGEEDSIRVWKIPDDAMTAATMGQINKSTGNLTMQQPQDAEIDRLIKNLSAPGPNIDLASDQMRLDELRNGRPSSPSQSLAVRETSTQRLDREIQSVERKIRTSVGQNRNKLRKDLTVLKLQKQIENLSGDQQVAAKKELEDFQSGKKDFVVLDAEAERPPGIEPSLRSIRTDFTFLPDNFKPARLAISNDGNSIVAGREPNATLAVAGYQPLPTVVQVWDIESGALLRSWKEQQLTKLSGLTFSSNDKVIFSQPDISTFNVLSGEWKFLYQSCCLAINRGETAANLNALGLTTELVKQMPIVRFFDSEQMTQTPDIVSGYEAKVTAMTFSQDGKYLYYCERGSRQHKLTEFEIAKKEAKVLEEFEHSEPWHKLITDGMGLEVLCISSDRKTLIGYGQYANADYRLKMWTRNGDKWSEKSNLPSNVPRLRSNDPSRMWLIKDKQILCMEDPTGNVQTIDLVSGKPLGAKRWRNVRWGKPETARSEDGTWYAWGDDSGRVEVWDMRDLKLPPRTFKAHSGPIVGVALSANGDRIITAGEENLIKIWKMPAPAKKTEPTKKSKKN